MLPYFLLNSIVQSSERILCCGMCPKRIIIMKMMQFIHALVVNSRNKLQIRLASNTFFPISIWESYQQDSKGRCTCTSWIKDWQQIQILSQKITLIKIGWICKSKTRIKGCYELCTFMVIKGKMYAIKPSFAHMLSMCNVALNQNWLKTKKPKQKVH